MKRFDPIIKYRSAGDPYPDMEEVNDGDYVCATDAQCALDKLRAQLRIAKEIIAAVEPSEFYGPQCNDIHGKNWFDAREEFLKP